MEKPTDKTTSLKWHESTVDHTHDTEYTSAEKSELLFCLFPSSAELEVKSTEKQTADVIWWKKSNKTQLLY